MKDEIRRMLAQGGGAIVNPASVAGLVGSRGAAAYIASKHAVVGLRLCSAAASYITGHALAIDGGYVAQ